jgi:para-nitrobenzyl esterase
MSTVRIERGAVRGAERDGVHSFLGIPYAAAPLGPRRWAAPATPPSWDGVREATAFGNSSLQTVRGGWDPVTPESEDCLNLNVWTPEPAPGAELPVMVWIHGGGFLNGSSAMPLWSGQWLAKRAVVVVSINYRLGVFGFLTHPDLGANFGVLDWVSALTWVRTNIAAFGGDSDNVTVFGQSAGGAAARALLCTPAARGLFHRAIIQSAGYEDYAVIASPSYRRSLDASNGILRRLGGSDIDQLRDLPAEKIREASFAEASVMPPPGQLHTPANLAWYPVPDGDIVTEDFTGWADAVPIMFGATQDEARLFHKPDGPHVPDFRSAADVYTHHTLEIMAQVMGGRRADDILAHFGSRGLTPYEALTELDTTSVWHEPALASYRRYAALPRRTAYNYRFARVSPGARRSGLLANHCAELAYLFGPITPGNTYDDADVYVSETVQHAWTEFARTGVPRSPDGTAWAACTTTDPQYTVVNDQTNSVPLEITPVCEMINSQRQQDDHIPSTPTHPTQTSVAAAPHRSR